MLKPFQIEKVSDFICWLLQWVLLNLAISIIANMQCQKETYDSGL